MTFVFEAEYNDLHGIQAQNFISPLTHVRVSDLQEVSTKELLSQGMNRLLMELHRSKVSEDHMIWDSGSMVSSLKMSLPHSLSNDRKIDTTKTGRRSCLYHAGEMGFSM